MNINPANSMSSSFVKRLRYLEWLLIIVHLIMAIIGYDDSDNFGKYLLFRCAVYSIFIFLSWEIPTHRPLRFRQAYILLGMLLIIGANFLEVNLDLLLYLYIAKSFFLLRGINTIYVTVLTGVGWIYSEYLSDLAELKRFGAVRFEPPFGVGTYETHVILAFSLALYVAVSIFILFFSSVIVAEYKSRLRAEQLAEQVEILAINLERTRIARDIHDSLGHTLTNLDMQLKVARKLRDRDRIKTWEAIDKASQLSIQCIEDVSHAVHTMRRSDFNLDRALSSLIEQIGNEHKLKIEWNINLPQVSLSTSHQIYCVVKEGLINIQKHSAASKVLFQGYATNTDIVLKLEDDGIGFNPQQIDSGFGLRGMLERVQGIRGKLKIDSIPGRGTQILVTIPR